MPQVNGKEYPYTPEGIKEAAKQRMSDQDRLNAINILLGTEDATAVSYTHLTLPTIYSV